MPSPLRVLGKIRVVFSRDGKRLVFDALVVKDLDVDILGGPPSKELNDVAVQPAKKLIMFGDGSSISYGAAAMSAGIPSALRNHSHVLRVSATTTVWPGGFVEVRLQEEMPREGLIALEPRTNVPGLQSTDGQSVRSHSGNTLS